MYRHPDLVASLASWSFGSYTLKLLSRDGRASLEPQGMFKVTRGEVARNVRTREPDVDIPQLLAKVDPMRAHQCPFPPGRFPLASANRGICVWIHRKLPSWIL